MQRYLDAKQQIFKLYSLSSHLLYIARAAYDKGSEL